MQFPRREIEIVRLAEEIAQGFAAHPHTFPAPPVQPAAIQEVLVEYQAAREQRRRHEIKARQRTAVQQRAVRRLRQMMAASLRYAEFAARDNAGHLQLVGWGAVRRPVHTELAVPGQVITLKVRQEGTHWVLLAWKPPFDGGPVAAYRVQRRRRDGGDWTDVGTSMEPMIRLDDQETSVELEYQVTAINRAGEGPPSNVVRVVL
jgi:hypothetical protein